jgi:hypothetical protein
MSCFSICIRSYHTCDLHSQLPLLPYTCSVNSHGPIILFTGWVGNSSGVQSTMAGTGSATPRSTGPRTQGVPRCPTRPGRPPGVTTREQVQLGDGHTRSYTPPPVWVSLWFPCGFLCGCPCGSCVGSRVGSYVGVHVVLLRVLVGVHVVLLRVRVGLSMCTAYGRAGRVKLGRMGHRGLGEHTHEARGRGRCISWTRRPM